MGDQHLHITILQLNASQCTIARGLTITQMICDRANQMGAANPPHSKRAAWTLESVTMT
jgi:hypothetical protein